MTRYLIVLIGIFLSLLLVSCSSLNGELFKKPVTLVIKEEPMKNIKVTCTR